MLEIRTADEVVDAEMEARWAARRADPRRPVLRAVLRAFVARGGPVPFAAVAALVPDRSPEAVRADLVQLDADDLLQASAGQVQVAYPFSTGPTRFLAQLADGRERYACCAIDLLGLAPMLGERILVRSECHQSRVPLAFGVTPEGPEAEAAGAMVWVGRREGRACLATSL